MAGYQTYELSQLLGKLSAAQRGAVARIVEHHYIANRPLRELFTGENPICSEITYYRRGTVDPHTGQAKRVGWSHQPDFVAALEMARRLALQTRVNEEAHAVQEAVRRARLAAAPIMTGLVRIAAQAEADRDKIAASKEVLGIALKNTEFGDRPTDGDLADDWWKAVEDDREDR